MPIYEYKCESCGKQFEYMQSISEAPKSECEACGGELRKLVSAAAFAFKGGGWYKDLYSSPKPGASSSESGGGGGAKKSESKSDSKKSGGSSSSGGKE